MCVCMYVHMYVICVYITDITKLHQAPKEWSVSFQGLSHFEAEALAVGEDFLTFWGRTETRRV